MVKQGRSHRCALIDIDDDQANFEKLGLPCRVCTDYRSTDALTSPLPNPPIHGQPPHLDLRCTATPSLHYTGFDVTEISEDSQEDLEGLDASALHISNLLSTEPTDVVAYKFGEKSAQALTSAGFRNLTFKNFDGYVQASMSFAKTTVNHLQSVCFTGFCLVNLFNRRGIMFGHTAGLVITLYLWRQQATIAEVSDFCQLILLMRADAE
uniref:Uncharacterized protein n=1 Tax=Chenopodium quinoa TaxID=63459 RepID=A0A803NAI7_CHEQI